MDSALNKNKHKPASGARESFFSHNWHRFKVHWVLYSFACLTAAVVLFSSLCAGKLASLKPQIVSTVSDIIKPDEAIQVTFSRPVNTRLIEESLKITPEIGGTIRWSEDGKSFVFVPEEVLGAGQKYLLAFHGQGDEAVPFEGETEVKVEPAPEVASFEPLEDQGVDRYAKIYVRATQPLTDYEFEFSITPAVPFDVLLNDDKNEYELMPSESFKENERYTVEVFRRFATNEKKSESEKIKEFSFSTLKAPQLLGTSPKNKAVEVPMKQKITVTFSKPMDPESFRSLFQLVPDALFTVTPNKDNTVFTVQPQELAEDTEYQMLVEKGMRAVDGSYFDSDQMVTFKTGNAKGLVYERRATTEPKYSEGRYIDANLSKQLLDIYDGGQLVATFKISSGKRGMNTPTGDYKVLRKELRHWSNKYKLWMPYSMQFTGAGHFIHELPEWPSGYKEGAAHLGIPVSHGCIRLGVGAAKTVYEFAEIGTPIAIHY